MRDHNNVIFRIMLSELSDGVDFSMNETVLALFQRFFLRASAFDDGSVEVVAIVTKGSYLCEVLSDYDA